MTEDIKSKRYKVTFSLDEELAIHKIEFMIEEL